MIKDFLLEDIDPIADLKFKLWQSIDILRHESINPSDYYFIFFLLILHKEELLIDLDISNLKDFKKQIKDRILDNDGQNAECFKVIFKICEPIYYKLNDEAIYSLINLFYSLNQNVLKEHFPEIFDDLLYKFSKSQGRHGGEFIQPLELSIFLCGLADLPENAKVYNPFAGLASFGVFLEQGQDYVGQELNKTTWVIGSLRIIAYERVGISRFLLGDSINNWNPISDKYDLIVANPPFNLNLSLTVRGKYGNIRAIEHFFIEKGVEDLTASGMLIAVIPYGFLFRAGSEKSLRQYLVENDLLDMVISIPSGLLMNTGIPIVVIVINKNKKEKGFVRFIDAKEFVNNGGTREKRLNYYGLNTFINHNKESETLRIVSNTTICEFDFNLNVPRYFIKEITPESGVKLEQLSNLLNIIHGQRNFNVSQGKFVRIRDLKDDKLEYQLDVNNIERTEIPKQTKEISESCLLLATRWKTLKPTYFNYSGESIFIRPDIIALNVNELIIDVPYLINEFHSDYVNDQFESIRNGITIPFVKTADLLSVKIKLPDYHYQKRYIESIREQKAKVSGIREASAKFKIIEAENNARALGFDNIFYENFASIKHSLGKPLMNIGSSVRNIEKAMIKLNRDWESIKISERMDVTLKDAFNSVYSNLEFIHSLLKNNERDFNVNNYKLSEFDFLKFFKAFVNKIKSTEKINVNVNIDINPELVNNFGKAVPINGNAELLEIALNNIVENANRHAFVDPKFNYKLEFRLSLYIGSSEKSVKEDTIGRFQSFLKIEIANNGITFPKNFSFEKFIRKNSFAGSTGNTGIGGYDINEIVKYHQGKLDLNTEDSKNEFVTIFIVLLPINTAN